MTADNSNVDKGRPRLLSRVIRAGSWTVAGQLTSQALRLAGNLVLTRLLFPDAFGLMAIVQAVLTGVNLLSDIGIIPSVVQNTRGEHPSFLNTAWTIQVIRGLIIWCAVALAAPWIANFYGYPILSDLLVVAGLASLISGFNSTKLAMADRKIQLGRVVAIEVGSYALGLGVTILWAWIDPTIWTLVWGNLVGAAVKLAASHWLLDGVANRFAMERDAMKSVFSFGKWILLSSVLLFLVGEGNRLVIAAFVTASTFSFFTLASTMSRTITQTVLQVGSRVMFSAYSEINRNQPDRLYQAVFKGRLALLAPMWLAALFFVFFGNWLMSTLYDPRYHESGWMLSYLAMGTLGSCVGASYEGVLMAKGKLRLLTWVMVVECIVQFSGILAGGYWYGPRGIVIAVAISGWLLYPLLAILYSRLGMWQPKLDLLILAMSAIVIVCKHFW